MKQLRLFFAMALLYIFTWCFCTGKSVLPVGRLWT